MGACWACKTPSVIISIPVQLVARFLGLCCSLQKNPQQTPGLEALLGVGVPLETYYLVYTQNVTVELTFQLRFPIHTAIYMC